jgi:hypothetical protein
MKIISSVYLLFFTSTLFAQPVAPDLSKINDNKTWKLFNRNVSTSGVGKEISVSFDAKEGDGLAVFQNLEFENGVIEFDVKGKDVLQKSFLGMAFHIQDENTFNAIYFRPFNFEKPERAGHSVQYICHPEFTWNKLRNDFPEQFENPVTPIPNPNEFFHTIIVINWPIVKVFVQDSTLPSLEVTIKSELKKGKIGFWVGNGSDGTFKNLLVTP